MYADGTLPAKLSEIYFGERPTEELYDVIEDPSQINNLASNPKYATVLKKHQTLLKQWISQGDAGIGEESDEEITYQGQEHKWGAGVNPEYEAVRVDNDGDGLSDTWEKVNGRDPLDGKMLFTFDCGGWQTEGWTGSLDLGNIAGSQGYLDFTLGKQESSLHRRGLQLSAEKNRGEFTIQARSDNDIVLQLVATCDSKKSSNKVVGEIPVKKGGQWTTVSIPLSGNEAWQGLITELELRLRGPAGTFVEFDSISIP
jgi:hypothetical protein